MILLSAIALLASTLAQTAAPSQVPPAQAAAPNQASAPQTAPSTHPNDPAELLEEAWKVNGLDGADVQPWHLKASYEVFDEAGNPKDKGTYEEWWVGEKQYKRSYQSPEFSQVEYGTARGIFRSQSPEWPRGAVGLVRSNLVNPLPGEDEIKNSKLTLGEVTQGETKLRCVSVAPRDLPANSSQPTFPRYCFQAGMPMLRVQSGFNNIDLTIFSKIVSLRGRFIGGDIRETRLGKPCLTIHLESIATLQETDAAQFTPPADAVAAPPRKITISPAVAAGRLLKRIRPDYPEIAKAGRVQGVVVVQAIIGRNGHIASARAVSGPTLLRDAAVDGVRSAVYSPYLLNGEPVEVETMVNVIFDLSRKAP